MMMLCIRVLIFLFILVPAGAFATQAWNRSVQIMMSRKELNAYNSCPSQNTVSSTRCDEVHAHECKLIGLTDAIGANLKDTRRLQNKYLMFLVRRYRVLGLTAMEAEARNRLETSPYELPEPDLKQLHNYVRTALDQASYCLPEHAIATLARFEVLLTNLDSPERLDAFLAVTLAGARFGDEGTRNRIARVRERLNKIEWGHYTTHREPPQRSLDGLSSEMTEKNAAEEWRKWYSRGGLSYAHRSLAKAAAEIGDYSLAAELTASVNRFDHDEIAAEIAQIAVRHGELERAIALVTDTSKSGNLNLHWTQFLARLGIIQRLVWQGEYARAVELSERWNTFYDPKRDQMPPIIFVHRMVALNMARHDAVAALKYVQEHEPAPGLEEHKTPGQDDAATKGRPVVCAIGLAEAAAQAGHPEQALAILNAHRPSVRPYAPSATPAATAKQVDAQERSVAIYIAAMIETAIAYRERGNETTANLLFDEALAMVDTQRFNAQRLKSLVALLGNFSPNQVLEYLNRGKRILSERDPRAFSDHRLMLEGVSSLRGQGRIADALSFYGNLVRVYGDEFSEPSRQLIQSAIAGPWSSQSDAPLFFKQSVIGVPEHADTVDCQIAGRR